MKMIRPVTITPDVLDSSTVPESEPVYNAGTTYALGAQVRGNTTPTAHRVFESAISSNTGQALSDPTKWIEVGATNRWKMFDGSVTSQTTRNDEITIVLDLTGSVDSVALLNIDAAEVNVTVYSTVDGEVFNKDFSLVSDYGVADWYGYFTEPIVRVTDLVILDIPTTGPSTMTITTTSAGQPVLIGALIVGLAADLGDSEYGSSVGIVDYSVKQRDDYGNLTILERAYARRGSFRMHVPAGRVDAVVKLLSDYRAKEVLYIGSALYTSTYIYGFYKDFQMEIAYQKYSLCSLELEGLT